MYLGTVGSIDKFLWQDVIKYDCIKEIYSYMGVLWKIHPCKNDRSVWQAKAKMFVFKDFGRLKETNVFC